MNGMNFFQSISPVGLFFIAVIVGLLLVAELDYDELNVLGNLFIGLGGLLVLVATQGSYLQDLEDASSREDLLKKELELLHRKTL
jgi:hypothetical protein